MILFYVIRFPGPWGIRILEVVMQKKQNLRRARRGCAKERHGFGVLPRQYALGAALALVGATLLSTGIGCSRQKYRTDADKEVYELLNTVNKSAKDKYWELEGFTLQESQCSRYANRYDPDAQPSPLDDATAARLMNDVEGPKGQKKWSKNGFVSTVENENWRQTLPAPNENGEIVLDQKIAFDLALLHSPDYRSALESVYLAAMQVTAERYAFDVKFYGGSSLFYQNKGAFKKDASTSTLGADTFDGGARKTMASGADAIVNLANSMVWTFTPGDQKFVPTTSLSYSLTQPFLRGAGRAIVLENLTRSERRLLANVRQLAFYQQGFYVGVLTGSSPVRAPSGSGYPSQGVSGAQVGGFYGLLASQVRIRNQESNVASLADNYQRYEEYFATSRVTNRTEVDRVRQNWLSSQKSYIQLKDNYRDSIEEYLMSLGLPPDIENVVVQDSLVDQFSLMPKTLENFQADISTLLAWLRNKNHEVVGDGVTRYVRSISDLKREDVQKISVADLRALFENFDGQFAAGLDETNGDLANLETVVKPHRASALNSMKERFERENAELDSSFFDFAVFDARVGAIREDLDRPKEIVNDFGVVLKSRGVKYNIAKMFELIRQTMLTYSPDDLASMIDIQRQGAGETPFSSEVLQLVDDLHMNSQLNDPIQFSSEALEQEIAELDKMAENLSEEDQAYYNERRAKLEKSLVNLRSGLLERSDVYRFWFTSCLTKLSEDVMTLRLIQARARLESIELSVVNVESDLAFQVARERRLDWMNARSNLVDQWRNIEIVADQLRSDLSVSVGGSIQNEGSNPVDFRAKNAQFSAGVQFDAPLDRFLERNSYRQALISYDQARRSYYAYVDGVHQQIRSAIRAIELAQVSFELQRDSVLTSIKRVHSAQLDLTKPPTGSSRVGSVDSSAEALTNALDNLLSSQNEFMQMWLQYQSSRMSLMLMLGVFNLDDTGRWIDPGEINGAMLQNYLAQASVTQDSLAGMDRLPSVEQLSGGRSAQALQQMGTNDLNANSLQPVPGGAPATYTFTVPRDTRMNANQAPVALQVPNGSTAASAFPNAPAAQAAPTQERPLVLPNDQAYLPAAQELAPAPNALGYAGGPYVAAPVNAAYGAQAAPYSAPAAPAVVPVAARPTNPLR